MSHNDELSLFLQEVADVRPLRSDHIAPVAGSSQPTEAQLARREAATAEQLTQDHPAWRLSPCWTLYDIVGFKRDGVQEGLQEAAPRQVRVAGLLDLHHKTLNEARTALVQFIAECEVRDIRCLLILHGRGAQHAARPASRAMSAPGCQLCLP